MTEQGPLAGLRRPEYTGENRCVPCTLANTAIAVVLAGVAGYAWLALSGGLAVAGVVTVAVLVLSGFVIWLRGYLVPGTPELTKRYFPGWLLAKFDKAPETATGGLDGETGEATVTGEQGTYDGPTDPETLLLDGGVVEPCAKVDDLCLVDGFREAWHARMATLGDTETEREQLAEQLDADPDSVTFEEHAEGAFTAFVDGTRVGQWESRAALVADLAAGRELPAWLPEWDRFPTQVRSQLLGGLRIFLETCPDCDGPVVAGRETVESCCRSYEVVAASCDKCGSRLLEVPYDEGMVA
jgi:hypothetical protein